MKRTMLLCAMLAGCAGDLAFIGPDGATHNGTFDALGKTMSVTIAGVTYSGPYVLGGVSASTSTITTTTVTPTGRIAFGSGQIFNPGSGGGNGRALLLSPSSGALSCEFAYSGMTAIGSCQDQAGRQYQFQTR